MGQWSRRAIAQGAGRCARVSRPATNSTSSVASRAARIERRDQGRPAVAEHSPGLLGATGRFLQTTSSIGTRPTSGERVLRYQHTRLCAATWTQKGDRARGVARSRGKRVSVQVLNEFTAVVATQASAETGAQIAEAVAGVFTTRRSRRLRVTLEPHNSAPRRSPSDHGLSFYDALIVSAAIEARLRHPVQRRHAARPQHRRPRHRQSVCR